MQNSNSRKNLAKYILELVTTNIILNDTSVLRPKELDIYIPDKKIAFEYDGLYWHSIEFKSAEYHINKTKACETNGIQLIHIFENEWIFKTDIVKANIQYILNENYLKLDVNAYTVDFISIVDSIDFQLKFSLTTYYNVDIAIGIKFANDIVTVVNFKLLSENKWQVLNICHNPKYKVVNGDNTVISKFENVFKPKTILYELDIRWNCKNDAISLGFNLVDITPPTLWCWKDVVNLVEIQNNDLNNTNCIYDCGKYIFLK